MKRLLTLTLLYALSATAVAADKAEMQKRAADSKAVVQQFFGQLKGELGKAMKSGGPIKAIEVCNTVAPTIAKTESDKHGWKVGRTSLKTRNPANAPDEWERKVLQQFEEQVAAGKKPGAYYEVVEQDGNKAFRFMKAIVMPPLDKAPCLKCHGENIDPKIAAKLDALYPQDMARGYKPGMVRGAFTITQPME